MSYRQNEFGWQSQENNIVGWQPPRYVKLRYGQKLLLDKLNTERKSVYAVQLPTGYGKSWCAAIAYAALKGHGQLDRMLLVVPTTVQREQYISDFKSDLEYLQILYRGVEACDSGSTRVLKKSLRNESDIFVTTVQSITADKGWFIDLMTNNSWLVVADEFHHYAEDKTWGQAISGLNKTVLLGMSATPIRGDCSPTIIGRTPDVYISYEDAVKEKACRNICVVACEYDITYSSNNDEPQTVTLSELKESLPENISDWEAKRRIRYHYKYINSLLIQVQNLWILNERESPGQNQILVFAMSCRHAESVCKAINNLASPGMPSPFAEWVGTGDGETENRTDEQNRKIIERFQRNEFPCLVNVNMTGEGFNNKRCSIGVMLDLVGDTPMKRQHVGRFTRMNDKDPSRIATIFVSTDSPCLSLLKNLEEQTEAGLSDEEKKDENKSGSREYLYPPIYDLFIIDTQYRSSTKIYPYGSLKNAVAAFVDQNPEFKNVSQEQLIAAMDAWCDKRSGVTKEPTAQERYKELSDQVNRNVGVLANILLRKRYGDKMPANAKNDVFRTIHGYYKRHIARDAQKDLTEDELYNKNTWLQNLRKQIVQGEIPSWLKI